MKLFGIFLFYLLSLSFVPNIFGQAKIVGGTDVTPGQYPWMVALAHRTGDPLFSRQFGGGTLIDENWVLTAAHCVEGESLESIEIYANLTDLNDSSGAEVRGIKGIYMFPSYQVIKGNLFNDLALILLDAPITTVTPVAFAQSAYAVAAGASVRAIGWGATQSTPYFPSILKMVDLSINTIASANRAYGTSSLDIRHLAASSDGKDTCSGDSGGPLFKIDGAPGAQPLLVGITSYGIGCAADDIPGIYTNVGYFAGWINAFLAQPTTGNADVTVAGNGIEIPNGSIATSTQIGTNFGRRLKARRSRIRQFTLSNAPGVIPLAVTSTHVSGSAFKIQSAPTYVFGGGTDVIRIKYKAPRRRRNGISKTNLTIRTNDPANRYYTFRLTGRYKKYKTRR